MSAKIRGVADGKILQVQLRHSRLTYRFSKLLRCPFGGLPQMDEQSVHWR